MGEKNLNFDEIISRKGTHCLKYDFSVRKGMPEDVLSLWLDSGKIFGEIGEGFQRINVAAPRAVVCECLNRIRQFVLKE